MASKGKRRGAQELLDELHTADANENLNEVERIYQFYSTIQGNGFSIRSLSLRIRSQASLAPSDIIDFGPHPSSGTKRYQVKPELYGQIETVVQSLQGLIDDLISLIPDREPGRRGFRIDPTNDLLEVLQGSDHLISLYGAYEVIRKRMDRAAHFLEKYYRLCKGEAISSPATTSAEVHEKFDPGSSTDKRILEHIAMTNSYGQQHTLDQHKELDAFMKQELDEVILLTKDVEQAFPNKPTSTYPIPYTYINAPSKRDPSNTYSIVKFSTNDQHYARVQYAPPPPGNVSFANVSHSTDKSEAEVERSIVPEGQSLEYEERPERPQIGDTSSNASSFDDLYLIRYDSSHEADGLVADPVRSHHGTSLDRDLGHFPFGFTYPTVNASQPSFRPTSFLLFFGSWYGHTRTTHHHAKSKPSSTNLSHLIYSPK
ncbi:hypothetical protein NLI96_g13165 [Meripilus lineatus]|uniref:Uncharacterized protein n=1 Tax=Meripilus lineatus TaxID=2056292 RepID=A0AAD5USG4_9APHY|nr:hypothetical protein NLI96_g13165 [Physisporinus lineatus]